MSTESIVNISEDLLSSKNINNVSSALYIVVEPGHFVDRQYEIRDEVRLAENLAEGGDGTFSRLTYDLKVQKVYPERGAGEERTLTIQPTRDQQEAIRKNESFSMRPGNPLADLVKDFEGMGFSSPLDEEVQGSVLVVATYAEPMTWANDPTATRTRHRFVGVYGNRRDYDHDAAVQMVDAINTGSKKVI